MSAEEHRAVRELLGSLALHHLSPADEALARAHLAGCATCRDELTALLPVVRQLDLLSPVAIEMPARPPAELGDRVAAAVEAARTTEHRRWYTRVGTAATAAALAASVASVVIVNGLQDDGPLLESVPVTIASTAVTAEAHLVAHTWGTEIKLDASGLEDGATYTVAIRTAEGEERAAGEFVGTGDQPMQCNLNSSVLRPDAVGFVVLDDSGAEVLASTFGA